MVVKKGEIFGLLGPNGAGKSTTFNMLTLKDCKSSGDVRMLGMDLEDPSIGQHFNNMGICPQANMLFESLTVVEHFRFYSMVKGLNFME